MIILNSLEKENSSPAFASSRKFADSSVDMVASLGFKKQLWVLDKTLDVVWDEASKKWEIWKFPGQEGKRKVWNQKAFHVLTIQTKNKTFRDLGADILLKLQQGDAKKYSLKQLVDYFDALDKNIRRQKNKKLMEDIQAQNREWAWYATAIRQPVPKEYIFETPNSLRVQRAIAGGL